jgi:actin related protein 2/3 complex, subunit 4
MASTLRAYIHMLRQELHKALCIQVFPSQTVEGHNKPQIEVLDSPGLVLQPVRVNRNAHEYCMIEASVNSVRISFLLRTADQLEATLTSYYTTFLRRRAEQLPILRRVPVDGFDISFLITDEHCLKLDVEQLVNFLCDFVEEVDRERSQLKLAVNSRSRAVGAEMFHLLST